MIKVEHLIWLIPIIHGIANVTTNYFPSGTLNPGSLRLLLFILIAGATLLYFKRVPYPKILAAIALFILYNLILVLLNKDVLPPLLNWIRMSIPLLFLFVSSMLVTDKQKFSLLNKSFILVLSVYCGNYIIANLFGFGTSIYEEDSFFIGGAGNGLTNEMSVITLIAFSYIKGHEVSRFWKVFGSIMIVVSIIIILVTLRRGAYLTLFLGFVTYFVYMGISGRDLKIVFASLVLLALSSPLYIDTFIERYELREDSRDGSIANIEVESRYMELFWVPEALNNLGLKGWLFGTHNLYSESYFGGRPLHVGYMSILHGSGLIGLTLFFLILLYIVYLLKVTIYRSEIYNSYYQELYALNIALIVCLMAYLLTSRFHGFPVTIPVFIVLGATLGQLNTELYSMPDHDRQLHRTF